MKKCVILGAMPISEHLFKNIPQNAFIICADAGILQAQKYGLPVDLAVGDWDSVLQSSVQAKEIITLPHEKDDTDLYFAARCAMERGFREVYILGGIGGRLDHTIANFSTLRFLTENGVQAVMESENTYCTVLQNGGINIPKRENAYLSVFSMDEKSEGVYLTGVYYPLKNATVKNNFPIGISNEFIEQEAGIEVKKGTLLVLITKE